MARERITLGVFSGTFESQPLVFAHLYDVAPNLDLDHVEVICRADPGPRLLHYLDANDVDRVTAALGLATTVVLVLPEAGDFGGSPLLTHVGTLNGTRVVP